MPPLNRRRFLRTGFRSAAGAIALSPSLLPVPDLHSGKNIIERPLGKTSLKVPVISFGVMGADNPSLCKAAYNSGILFFDSGNSYQNGKIELMCGKLFKDFKRDSFIIQIKIKPRGVSRDGRPTDQTTTEDLLVKFNASLSRLQVEYVDILLIDGINNPEMLDYKPVVSALEKLKKQKKTRFIGFSTHNNMAGVIDAAACNERWDVILTSYNFMLNNLDEMHAALRKANHAGTGIIAMNTIDSGAFLDKGKTKPVNSSASIKWALSNTDIHTVIAGMTSYTQLESNLKILDDTRLTEQERKELMIASLEVGMYCSGCNNCLNDCIMDLPIPDLMRAYMYSYGYSNLPLAYSLLGELGTGPSPCVNCEYCRVNCKSKFDIKEKITDVSRLVSLSGDFIT